MQKDVSVMMAKVTKSLMLGVMLTVTVATMQRVWTGAPQDPLAEWEYPKAKQKLGETWERPLPWAVFATTDPFEKVWEFYWQNKISKWGMPIKKPMSWKEREGGSFVSGVSGEETNVAFFYDPHPTGKLGILTIRRKDRTVIITIMWRAKEKVTTIVLIVDQR